MPLWRPLAVADLNRIVAYIAQDNRIAAIGFGDSVIQKALMLDQQPKLGRVGRVQGTRELVVHPNYILIYRSVGKATEVLRVKHAAQMWP